jgi:hypothetical protein
MPKARSEGEANSSNNSRNCNNRIRTEIRKTIGTTMTVGITMTTGTSVWRTKPPLSCGLPTSKGKCDRQTDRHGRGHKVFFAHARASGLLHECHVNVTLNR